MRTEWVPGTFPAVVAVPTADLPPMMFTQDLPGLRVVAEGFGQIPIKDADLLR